MALGMSVEILDLRHFAAPVLRPVLEAEGELWKQRLHWDYRASARLLMQYLDSHMLPGYAAVEAGQVTGYVFCVYEETKAVIGDVFALSRRDARISATAAIPAPDPHPQIEEMLLRHLFELLLNSPHVDRIESQLLLHPSGAHAAVFRQPGSRFFAGCSWSSPCRASGARPVAAAARNWNCGPGATKTWAPAARLICEAYRDHPDSLINDQYRSAHGSMRFLNNIVRYSGCGTFSPQVSHVDRRTRQAANWWRWCWVRASARRADTSPSCAFTRVTGAAGWPACCSRWPPSASCAWDVPRSRSL